MAIRLIRGCFTITLVALSAAPAAWGQVRGGFAAHASFGGSSRGTASFHRSARFGSAVIFSDPYYYGDYASGGFVEDGPPRFFVLPQPAPPEPPSAPIHPLLIELQGDHYVRVGEAQNENHRMAGLESVDKRGDRPKDAMATSRDLTPTVLIYRNGFRENIPQYAIVGKTIYARGNYWRDGYWTKNIQIAALNLPATIRANRDIGVNFVLPDGPGEVVTRP